MEGKNGVGHTSVFGPLYPFGYGLSYAKFGYSGLAVTTESGRPQGDVEVSVDITNTGSRTGDEVIVP